MKDLDKMVHEKSRLAILTVLRTNEAASFKELKAQTQLTDGMLSVQTRKLEEAKYITVTKRFVGKKPLTTYRIAKGGKKAFDQYLEAMEAIIAQVRTGG